MSIYLLKRIVLDCFSRCFSSQDMSSRDCLHRWSPRRQPNDNTCIDFSFCFSFFFVFCCWIPFSFHSMYMLLSTLSWLGFPLAYSSVANACSRCTFRHSRQKHRIVFVLWIFWKSAPALQCGHPTSSRWRRFAVNGRHFQACRLSLHQALALRTKCVSNLVSGNFVVYLWPSTPTATIQLEKAAWGVLDVPNDCFSQQSLFKPTGLLVAFQVGFDKFSQTFIPRMGLNTLTTSWECKQKCNWVRPSTRRKLLSTHWASHVPNRTS